MVGRKAASPEPTVPSFAQGSAASKGSGPSQSESEETPNVANNVETSVAASKPSRRDDRYEKTDFAIQWDPQEGLMPQILGLISSPRNNKDVKKKKNNSILLIGSNRECSSCGEGGDVVCCSRCNSCFHVLCHNPPLDESCLPVAKWVCFNCSATIQQQASLQQQQVSSHHQQHDNATTPASTSTISSSKQYAANVLTSSAKKTLSTATAVATTTRSAGNRTPRQDDRSLTTLPPNNSGGRRRNANAPPTRITAAAASLNYSFGMLLEAIETDNSEEFQLAKDISLPYAFAGYGRPSKRRLRDEMKAARLDRRLPCTGSSSTLHSVVQSQSQQHQHQQQHHHQQQALRRGRPLGVPTFVRTCFTCERSARVGPLIACDYCPLMFHADCVDPPLATLPLTRWMCPNHPNHVVDDKMITGRHSERVRLWDEFCNQPVTERRVMLDFFHKNSRRDPPFNRKRRIEPEGEAVVRVAVPSHIKAMYRAARRRREQHDWLGGVISLNPRVIDLNNLTVDDIGDTTVRLLAARMLEQLRADRHRRDRIHFRAGQSSNGDSSQTKLSLSISEKVQPRAFLTPGLGSSGPQLCIAVGETHLAVGACSSADVNLCYFGDCKYASARHAVIFYDDVTDRFELVNYSEFGTHVDGVLYSHDIRHILHENRPLTESIRASIISENKRKIKEKRAPLKRGRKSKAEKAALAAAVAAATATGSDIEEVDLTGWADDGPEAKDVAKLNRNAEACQDFHPMKTEAGDSEDTLSCGGGRSTPLVPKSETSDVADPHNVELNSIIKKEPSSARNDRDGDASLGDINGPPKSCICEQNNLMGRSVPPPEGFEGSAILHDGSVLKIGCIVLLFNISH